MTDQLTSYFTGLLEALGRPITKAFNPSQARDKRGRWTKPGREQLPAGVIHGGDAEVQALLSGSAQGFHAVRLGDVKPEVAARIKASTGLDVEGYHHRLDADAIRHIRNQHGPGNEDDPALVPVTDDDILKARAILEAPDAVAKGDDRPGRPTLIFYMKDLGDEFVIIEEVRTGRRELAVTTIYKIRAKGGPGGNP